ncbi:SET and MYND domain-containing protein 4-like [Panulirus ornatus]|uniref:SET and MYND domain-containing protein 4-like n=1 Tax=Panulirus ornatus TaxID=150431 RepID=UPI003A89F1CF
MAVAPCFDELFSNLIKELKGLDKIKEVSSHFGPQQSLEDMFSYIWDLEEAHHCLKPTILNSGKSDTEAERLRTEGNKYYRRKCLDKALELYNMSIMFAPHPRFTAVNGDSLDPCHEILSNVKSKDIAEGIDRSSDDTYGSLALGYANRSAVLLELGQYEKCIKDIDMAFRYGYPKMLHSKLAERKAKCLIAQNKGTEAEELLKSSLEALDALSLDETKSKASRDSLYQLLHQCQQDERSDRSSKEARCTDGPSKLSYVTREKLLFCYKTPKPPELPHPNSAIPSLSSAVKLAFSPAQGRYLMADRDIKPGEVLVVEEGYSRVLHLDSSLRTHCSGCLARCLTPLPCPSCSKVIFCSEACRLQGLVSYHARECSVLPSLAALDMGKNSVLAFRILIQTSYIHLKDTVPVFICEAIEQIPETLGFNDKGIYNSADYRSIYHLVTNKENRSVSDLFKRCTLAFTLTKLLQDSQQFFIDATGKPFTPSYEDILLIGSTLFVHMMNLPCNAHSITELQVNVSSYQSSVSQEIGCGAFGVLSLTNHSCNPAAARFSYGSVEVLRAIRFIPVGTEISDSYGEHFGINEVESRKADLMQQYYFTCSCEPCKNNWPTYLSLSSELMLKCLKCSRAINCSTGQCAKCMLDYTGSTNASLSYNWKNVDGKIKLAKASYNDAYKDIVEGISSVENRDKVCEFIEIIDKYIQLPNKLYFEAQESLKHWFDRQGSCNFVKEEL